MKIHTHKRTHLPAQGFTLLEMVIVLGIIAMILGGGIYMMTGIRDSAKISQTEADFKALESDLNMYQLLGGSYPTTSQGLNALIVKPTSTPVPRRWNKARDIEPLDPWKNPYIYRYPGSKNASKFEIISKGPDGQENTDDDISSQDE